LLGKMGLFDAFKESNVLYFPGCFSYFKFRENFHIYQDVLIILNLERTFIFTERYLTGLE